MMRTIKEMAEILELSPSTISKALHDSPEISAKTKQRVNEAAKTFGYIPNHTAQSLKSKRTKTIGVVVPNIIDDFFAKALHGVVDEASKYSYTVLITFSNDRKADEDKNLLGLLSHNVDGILISFSKETQRLDQYTDIGNLQIYDVPIVMFDRVNKEMLFDSVAIDDFDGAHQATKHLIDTGCKRIGFLSPISNTSVGRSRKQGYVHALSKENHLRPFYIEFGNYRNFEELLTKKLNDYQLDAILAADELSAIYSLNIIQRLGYKIPTELSIIGFTDGPMAKSANPPLTTVSQHAEKIGHSAFRVLHKRIRNKRGKPQDVVLSPKLIVRGTTKI